ncbi:MAG: DUF3618 domain-containing protein [Cellulomonadaceae bacterium]
MSGQPNPEKPERSVAEIQVEIAATRAELADSIDTLTARLDPRYVATQAGQSARQAAQDAAGVLTGKGLPEDSPRRARNVKVLLGVAGAAAALVALAIVRRARR